MTTTFVLLGILLLALVAGGWWLQGWRVRTPRVAAASLAWVPAKSRPAGSVDSTMDATAGATGDELLARLVATAFEAAPGDQGQADPADAVHAQVVTSASALLSRMEPGSRYAPRRPQLLPQLLNAVNGDDSSGREIAAIIARDPALAGNLLRIANSALYRITPEPVGSIARAVALIGIDGLRQLIAVALMQPVMSGGPGGFGRLPPILWEQTLLSAVATVEHACRVERMDAFTAQMLGLLYGLGSIVVVQVVRDRYGRHPGLAPDAGVVAQLLQQWAARTARRLAQDWALSDRIAPALDDQRSDLPAHELSPLGRALRIGRVAGAATLLQRSGAIDVETVLLLLRRLGLHEDVASPIWERLSRS